ncbi:MAG TPA: molecular chaperone DnaJ [Terriglobales bacterium]|jgi:molecular chaperone DnaJ|nr:molecular chaperone DnaJ [Terriglobales bacterium]
MSGTTKLPTNEKRDFYEVLGVSRTSTDQEIKSAYRRMAMQYHPDRNPGDAEAEEKFKECSEAYAVLADANKRATYDRYGHAGVNAAGAGAGMGFDPAIFQDFGDIFGNISDLFGFGDIFGAGSRRRTRATRGADLREDLTIEFEQAVFGHLTSITVRRRETCEVCSGTGAAPGKAPTTCATCGGRGQLRYQQGFFTVARTCSTCQGTGTVVSDPCQKCHGEGRVLRDRVIEVKIPAGVEDETRIRFSGQGEGGLFGGPAGDLYVVLHVKEHKFFEREGNDLYCTIPISFAQAALGTEIDVATLDGEHKLKIPEGTQSGTNFRIKGKGVPVLNSRNKGDLYVHVKVQTPTKLSKRQRELLHELDGTISIENKPERSTLLSKVKDIFG